MKGGAHQVTPLGAELEQELIQLQGSSCDRHKDEQVKLYCYDCNKNICLVCFAAKHRNHSSGEITEVAETLTQRIDEDDTKMLSNISTIQLQSEKTKQEVLKFSGQAHNVKKTIVEAGDAIKQLVDNQVSEHLLKLDTVILKNAKQAEIVQERLQLALTAMDSFHTYSRELLDKGRPSDIRRAASELHKRATELLDNDITSVQYCPPQVTFTPADVTHLTSLQMIGKLSVSDIAEVPGRLFVL